MHWSGLALLGLAAALSCRWWLRRTDALGRARPFPWFSTISACLLGCLLLWMWLAHTRLEDRLGAVASQIAGVEATIDCQGFGEAFVDAGAELGSVDFGPDGPRRSALIKRSQCAALSDYLTSDKRDPTTAQVIAVHVLTHEAVHMSGVTSEAVTECLAIQYDARAAELLGAPPEYALSLSKRYWTSLYPRMPTEYRSDECGPNGRLDADIASAPWAATQ
jgi:hypothetical protein